MKSPVNKACRQYRPAGHTEEAVVLLLVDDNAALPVDNNNLRSWPEMLMSTLVLMK